LNGVDFFILSLVALNVYWGSHRGLYPGLFDLVSLVLALVLATWTYPAAAWLVEKILGLQGALGGLLGFVLMALLVIKLGTYLLRLIPEQAEPSPKVNKISGGVIGSILGVILAALLLSAFSSLPGHTTQIEGSLLGRPFVDGVPRAYGRLEAAGLDLPKLVRLPRDYQDELRGVAPTQLQFRRLNFAQLDGATCIKCRGPMKFLGYFRKEGSALSPKFQCAQCGRTTDGCQSFEGFHRMYRRCPTEVANDGYLLDCGVWTNGEGVVPQGPCPVCGRVAQPPSR